MNSARHLQTGRYPSCEPASSYYSLATAIDGLHIPNRGIHAGAVTRHQRRVSKTPAGHGHALNTCTHENFKIRGSTTPHPPTRKASASDHSLEGYRYLQRRH